MLFWREAVTVCLVLSVHGALAASIPYTTEQLSPDLPDSAPTVATLKGPLDWRTELIDTAALNGCLKHIWTPEHSLDGAIIVGEGGLIVQKSGHN